MAALRTSPRARRTLTTVTAVGCLLLGTAAAANAAPKADLSPPKVLSAENSRGEAADIAVRDDGSAVAVWTQTMNTERRATVQVALQDSAGMGTTHHPKRVDLERAAPGGCDQRSRRRCHLGAGFGKGLTNHGGGIRRDLGEATADLKQRRD